MKSHTINPGHAWRIALLLALIPVLISCSRIDGSVELNNAEGESYSFEGATVDVFDLNPAAVTAGQPKTKKGIGKVMADGAIVLLVVTGTIDDDALYSVEVRCPTGNASDTCNVESPLHTAVSGAQLKAHDWKVTALTEVAFQNIAYYAATAYSADDILQILDNNAKALLLALPAGVQKTYSDLVAWSAANTGAVKRAGLINTISESLASGIAASDLKALAQQAVSAELSSLYSEVHPFLEDNFEVVKVIDGRVYMHGSNVAIIDIRNPHAIALAGIITDSIGGPITISGNFVYAAGVSGEFQEDTLFIFDISNPQQPQTVGQLTISSSPRALATSGGYVYVGNSDYLGNGDVLDIINVTDPATPALVGTLNIFIDNLLAAGAYVYVTNTSGIQIVDVSNPSAPVVVSSLAMPRLASSITLIGDYAYVTIPGAAISDPVQLQVFDIHDKAAPTVVTELTLLPGTSGLTVIGARAYADTSTSTQILDISNAAVPVLADSFPNAWIRGIRLSESTFFSFDLYAAVSVVDSTIAALPVVQSASMPIENAAPTLVASEGRYAYVPNRGDYIEYGFQAYDLIDPLAPALITTFWDAGYISSFALSDDHAFFIEAEFGEVAVANISNPMEPAIVNAGIRLDDDQEDMFGLNKLVLSGNNVFVPWGQIAFGLGDDIAEWGCANPTPGRGIGGLFAVDVSTPAEPVIASHLCMPEEASTVAVNGNHAYVGVTDGTLRIVDYADTEAPVMTGSVELVAVANAATLINGYLWVAEGGGVEVFNISNPTAPVLVAHLAVPGNNTSIDVDGHYAYVAAGLSGVHIFDIDNPALPRLVGTVSSDLPALSVFVENSYLYAATSAGLEIFRALPGNL